MHATTLVRPVLWLKGKEQAMNDTIRTVLVPVDFSPYSDEAVAYATRLARRLDASIELLHVVEDPYLTGTWSPDIYVPDVIDSLAALVSDAQDRLERTTASVRAQGVPATAVVRRGSAARAIIEHAATGDFDLIVLGTHGRTGLAHVLLGSVAERVVRLAPCPVLTVKATSVRQTIAASVAVAAA
jgi:nucleotide-binding universal stress UspA family protein